MAFARLKSLHKVLSAMKSEADPEESTNSDSSQIELAHQENNIWSAIRTNNRSLAFSLIEKNPEIMNERGPVGETPLHMCCLFGHKPLAKELLEKYPHLTTAEYEKGEYHGENILHIAIIQKDFEFIKFLIQREPKLLNARADGNFFKRGQACYYGEYPLLFACCTGQKRVVKLLLDHGADLNVVDSNGNSVLHLLVLQSRVDMYSFVKNQWIKRHASPSKGDEANMGPIYSHTPLWKVRNSDGFTPFTLAAKEGNETMFSFLLEENKQTQWTYGPVSCFLYPLQELDLALSGVKDENPNYSGALEIIVNEAHLNLLMHGRILDLIKQKWDRFAQKIFFQRFVSILTYLLVFTATTIANQTAELTAAVLIKDMEATLIESHIANSRLGAGSDINHEVIKASAHTLLGPSLQALNGGFFSFVSELFTSPVNQWPNIFSTFPVLLIVGNAFVLSGALYKLISEGLEMASLGFKGYFSSAGSAFMENTLSLIFTASVIIVSICRVIESPAEQAFLALASVLGWIYLFFFLLAFRLTGPMVVMIYQMLMNDVLRFLTIYSVFLIGFSQAFFVLFAEAGWDGFIHSIQTCFVAMLGDFDLDRMVETPYTAISVGLLVTYVVVITILLVNLLIAMMGDTYSKVNDQAEMQWHLERARIIFAIEHEMSALQRKRNKYWIGVDGIRYLQVISVDDTHYGAKGTKKDDQDDSKDKDQKKDD